MVRIDEDRLVQRGVRLGDELRLHVAVRDLFRHQVERPPELRVAFRTVRIDGDGGVPLLDRGGQIVVARVGVGELEAEDIGAEPMPILNCGMACQFNLGELVPLDQLGPYIQDVIDLIEFANRATPDLWSLASHVVRTYMNFTVAHEVGHIVLGHLKGANVGEVSLTEGRQCRASVLKLQDEEYEADDWAADALFAVAGTDFTEQTLALTAPALSFSLTALPGSKN